MMKLGAGLALAMAIVAHWQKTALPNPTDISPLLLTEPQQQSRVLPAKQTTVGGVTYTINPLYRYELYGLVVSRHDTDSWRDYLHQQWQDHINVMDVCVVWGNNIRRDAYRGMSFSSGQFTCNYSTRSEQVYRQFDQAAISNNHLLTDEPYLAHQVRQMQIGDQIHLVGYLAEYRHHQGFEFFRGTSTVRTDTGNGACETIWLEKAEIIRQGGGIWPWLEYAAWLLVVISLMMELKKPFVIKD